MNSSALLRLTDTDLAAAVAALGRGECIGLPTETVYGLAADASSPDAVRRIFALKGRPADHPLIVHLPDADALPDYAIDIPDAAWALAKAFWPGPLTLILKRSARVPDEVTGGQDTVGLRVPGHPIALHLLQAFGRGLAAPSANRFGRISPTTAQHVRDEFGADVPIVLDGGACPVGIESTIVDLSGSSPRILRPGMLDAAAIEAVIGRLGDDSDVAAPRVSGALEKHYAPRAPLRLVDAAELATSHADIIRLSLDPLAADEAGLCLGRDPVVYARGLYDALRQLDAAGVPIWVDRPPATPAWEAINDRLRRAAAGSGEARQFPTGDPG